MNLVPIILSGGSGSRLWPLSREEHPKPFIRLADGESFLQKAFLRGASLQGVKEILTVTNRDLFFKTRDDFSEVNSNNLNISYLLEPSARNTAAAVASAVLFVIQHHGENAEILVLAADHLIENQNGFEDAVSEARVLARSGYIVTFGIKPTAPDTGFGYIEAEGNHVIRFVEKPSLDKALEFSQKNNFFWNAGIFCFTAGVMLTEMKKHCPEILQATKHSLDSSQVMVGDRALQVDLDETSYLKVPKNSIDYAVMERSDRIAIVSCDIGWNDIGSWTSFANLSKPDEYQNHSQGEVLIKETRNCIIHSEDRLVAVLGVEDLIIVDTSDALLVANRSKSQDVKHIYAQLQNEGHLTHKIHRKVKRPWGTYTVLEEGEHFKIKRIMVKPGGQLSLQMHHHRSEHWIVVSGTAKVINDSQEFIINSNESTYILPGHKHRLENPGLIDLVLIEVQSGAYLGEDDIVRFDDIYGRVKPAAKL